MKTIQITMLFAVLTFTMLSGNGCIFLAAGAGAGTVAYVRGDLEATVDAKLDKTYDATLKALQQLELTPTEKQKDAIGAKVIARTSTDKKITITLAPVTDKLTKISVRIGVFGDQTISQMIYDNIKKNL
jgi:hypothetical protein